MDRYSARFPGGYDGFDYSQAGMETKAYLNNAGLLSKTDWDKTFLMDRVKLFQVETAKALPNETIINFFSGGKPREEMEQNIDKPATSRTNNCREFGQGGFA